MYLVEGGPVFSCDGGDVHDGLDVVGVDVEDWCVYHACDVSAVGARP